MRNKHNKDMHYTYLIVIVIMFATCRSCQVKLHSSTTNPQHVCIEVDVWDITRSFFPYQHRGCMLCYSTTFWTLSWGLHWRLVKHILCIFKYVIYATCNYDRWELKVLTITWWAEWVSPLPSKTHLTSSPKRVNATIINFKVARTYDQCIEYAITAHSSSL